MAARCLLALPFVATVGACAGGTTPTAQPARCSIEQVAEVSVHMVRGHILAPAKVNYTPVQLLVDTGASSSLLTPDVAQLLRLPNDSYRTTTVHGTGGVVVTHNVMVRSLQVGGQDWQGGSITTGRLDRRYEEDPPVAGLLGADHLTGFDVELDIPHQRMVLWRVQHCTEDFVPWQAPHFALRLTRYQPNRMVTQVHLDGHAVTALIDWGAAATTITTGTADTLGVTADVLAHDRSGSGRGVDQNEVPFHLHRFAELKIGPGTFRNLPIEVADLRVADVGMLLGADYVASRHVWLSYASDQMFVEARPPPTPSATP